MSRKKSTMPTELELDIMRTLWDNETSMTISEIAERLSTEGNILSVASVSQVMKRLMEKGMVKVCDHKLVSNVYARTFSAVFGREDYLESELKRLQSVVSLNKKASTMGIFQTLLRHTSDWSLNEGDLKELEEYLEESKKILREQED